MDLRQSLDVIRRHKWFLIEAVLLVSFASGILSNLRAPQYEAEAKVLLRPDDPTERLNSGSADQPAVRDPARYVASQKSIAESRPVAEEASKALGAVTATEIAKRVAVRDGSTNDILTIFGRDTNAARARDMANAVTQAYIENRRRSAVDALDRAVSEIQSKLGPLQASISDLDRKIATAGNVAPAGTAAIAPPTALTDGPSAPASPTTLSLATGDGPLSGEALKAARYAAAVQYEALYSRQQDLKVDISLKRGEAELIELAKTPTDPVSPRPLRDTGVGAAVGLLVGAGVVVLREQLDDRARSPYDVEQASGLPILAQLPYDEHSANAPDEVAAISRPRSALSEAVRALRTSIEYLSIDRPVRVIVVTSAAPAEGKSLVSANLAAVFADAGYRTLLLSADLRRAGISQIFGVPPRSPGLTNLVVPVSADNGASDNGHLGHGHSEEENWLARTSFGPVAQVVKTPMRNLLFLPSGPVPPNPAELLGSRRMNHVLSELRREADLVILDTPPLLPVTDAAVLAAKADGVVLVAAVGESRRSAVQRAKTILEATQARILGVAVNKVPRSGALYSYKAYSEQDDTRGRRPWRRSGRRRSGDTVPDGEREPRRRERRRGRGS